MLILMSSAISKAVNSRLVNCERWRVLKLSGSPKRAMASSTASMQKAVSIVIEGRQACYGDQQHFATGGDRDA